MPLLRSFIGQLWLCRICLWSMILWVQMCATFTSRAPSCNLTPQRSLIRFRRDPQTMDSEHHRYPWSGKIMSNLVECEWSNLRENDTSRCFPSLQLRVKGFEQCCRLVNWKHPKKKKKKTKKPTACGKCKRPRLLDAFRNKNLNTETC